MNEIKRAKYNDLLIRATGQDVGPPAPFLGGEIVPTFPVEQLSMDMRWLLGQRTYRARGSLTGGGAAVAAFRISNSLLGTAATTGFVVVIEKIDFMTPTAQQISLGVGFSNAELLATPVTNYGGLDTRGTPAVPGTTLLITRRGAASVAQDTTQLANVYSTAIWSQTVQANVVYTLEEEFVLSPGFCLDVYCNTVATVLWWNIRWRERPLDQLELAG